MKTNYFITIGIISVIIIVGIIFINQKDFIKDNNQISLLKEMYETTGKAPFTCTIVPNENYSFVDDSLIISFNGNEDTFNFEKVEVINELKSVNQDVLMKFHLYPDDTDSTFYATLFIGGDTQLYNCYGGVAKPLEQN